MKFFINTFDTSIMEQYLQDIAHLDISLFIDNPVSDNRDLSSINIMVLVEPNEYFGLHDWTIKNKHLFQVILTWSDKVLNNYENAVYFPIGGTWMKPEQYNKNHPKKHELAHLCGALKKSYGHLMRHEILERQNEFINIPLNFHHTVGDRYDLEDARKGKEQVFGESQYGIVIENFQRRGFFTEKIIDCFLLKTIPIYWGAPDIETFFDDRGIITFSCVDDLINHVEYGLPPYDDEKIQQAIKNNYEYAVNYYINIEQRISQAIKQILQNNGII